MKGKISNRLELILQDEGARSELRRHLIVGRGGRIRVNGRVFSLELDKATSTQRAILPRMTATK